MFVYDYESNNDDRWKVDRSNLSIVSKATATVHSVEIERLQRSGVIERMRMNGRLLVDETRASKFTAR